MDNFFQFIRKRWFTILVITILIYILYSMVNQYCFTQTEGMESGSTVNESLKPYLRKDVCLKCKVDGKDRYLAISSLKQCLNLKKGTDECLYNVPILQPSKNEYAVMHLEPKFGGKNQQYRLSSRKDDVTPSMPRLSQNLVLSGKSNMLCFDDGSDNLIHFEIGKDNSGLFFLKFNNKYVSACVKGNNTCQQMSTKFQRVCLVDDPTKALGFSFELHTNNKQKVEEFDGLDDVTNNLLSNYSNTDIETFSSDTDKTLNVPGMAEPFMEGFEENMSWN